MATRQHIFSGTAPPAITPTGLGQHYVDTAAGITYISIGTTSSADWQEVGAGGGGLVTYVADVPAGSPATYVVPDDADLLILRMSTGSLNKISLPVIANRAAEQRTLRVFIYNDATAPNTTDYVQFFRSGSDTVIDHLGIAGQNAWYRDMDICDSMEYSLVANPLTNEWAVSVVTYGNYINSPGGTQKTIKGYYWQYFIDGDPNVSYTINTDADVVGVYRSSSMSSKPMDLVLPDVNLYLNPVPFFDFQITGKDNVGASSVLNIIGVNGTLVYGDNAADGSGVATLTIPDCQNGDVYRASQNGDANAPGFIVKRLIQGIQWTP